MKEVMAVVRINQMNRTKEALTKAGITSFTVTGRVMGRGKGLVDHQVLKAADEGDEYARALLGSGPRLISKRMILVIVPDDMVDVTVDTLIKTNQTGKAGDGKIFVLPATETYRVRTGENGDSILQ
ncbi:MAG: P-II family nitrogen regulator [Spirochaetales bacterium]|nr:P-II family nitrogen regulator [Spirochaetales bacterium]